MTITLKLRGSRLTDAADWMLGHSVPEEVDGEGLADWEQMGVDLKDGVLTVPTNRLADFIEDLLAGADQVLNMSATDEEDKDAEATARALTTIAERLTGLAPESVRAAALHALHG